MKETDSVLKFYGMYRGLVASNLDPLLQGKIQIQVYPMLAGVDLELLPWAAPAMPLSSGAGAGYGSFAVPLIGSFVWVFFEAGDIYQPVYFAEAQAALAGLPVVFQTSYPYRRGFVTGSGIAVVIDDEKLTINVAHPTGAEIAVAADGAISVNSPGDVEVISTKAVTITGAASVLVSSVVNVDVFAGGHAKVYANGDAEVKAGGKANLEAAGAVTIKGATVGIN